MASDMFVKSIILTALTLGMVSINSISLAAVLRSKYLRKQQSTPFLVSHFVADLLQAVLGTSVSAVLSWVDNRELSKNLASKTLKQFHGFGLMFPPLASCTSVAALAVVKMVTIIRPLRISSLLTNKKIVFILILIWILPLSLSLLHFISVAPEYNFASRRSWEGPKDSWLTITAAFVIYLPCIFILTGSNITIFIVVIRQMIKIRNQAAPLEDSAIQMPNLILAAFKSSKSIIAVISIYLLLYVAPVIFFFFTVGRETHTDSDLTFWLYWLPYTEGFWNSFFYICINKAAKKELRKMFCAGQVEPGSGM